MTLNQVIIRLFKKHRIAYSLYPLPMTDIIESIDIAYKEGQLVGLEAAEKCMPEEMTDEERKGDSGPRIVAQQYWNLYRFHALAKIKEEKEKL